MRFLRSQTVPTFYMFHNFLLWKYSAFLCFTFTILNEMMRSSAFSRFFFSEIHICSLFISFLWSVQLTATFFGLHAATIGSLTDLGFLWFREFYLESSRVIQVEHFCIPL